MCFKKQTMAILIIILLLSISVCAEEYIIYQVKKGDTLTRVAKIYYITLEELITVNEISNPDLILSGDKILIPAETKMTQYQVNKGDTLYKIAEKYMIDIRILINYNYLNDPDLLQVGQVINIPHSKDRNRYHLAARTKKSHFIWPVQGLISSNYGWRIHPFTGKREFHSGLDIAVPVGSPVYAAESGVVVYSGWSRGYGNLIILRHRDGYLTYYAHNYKLLLKKNQIVQQGKIIALSGSTGLSTGPHLHFEIRDKERSCDPMKFLNQSYLQNGFQV